MFIEELAYEKEYIKADTIEEYCKLEGLEPIHEKESIKDSILKLFFPA